LLKECIIKNKKIKNNLGQALEIREANFIRKSNLISMILFKKVIAKKIQETIGKKKETINLISGIFKKLFNTILRL
jgi:hypothetical protein